MKGFEIAVRDYGNILTLKAETYPGQWLMYDIGARATAEQTAIRLEAVAATIRKFNDLPAKPLDDAIFKGR